MRVMLDTNILISAFMHLGTPSKSIKLMFLEGVPKCTFL